MPPMMNFQGESLAKSRFRLRWLCTPKAAAANDNSSWKKRLINDFCGSCGVLMALLLAVLLYQCRYSSVVIAVSFK